MSYTALYRKFRPNTFSGVVGQNHIVKTLKNQMISGRVSHAYLFCGTRGTGKTSMAKIFAKAINCLDLQEGEPCGKCEMCLSISTGRSVNVMEIDAASNNGVDNIRDIKEEVKYPPTNGKYKVYIIDEVHMLSTGAFNALLKTLEEPPEHVIFILATTDPQKVPATIHSRCQRFDFKRITTGEIALTLKSYLELEGVKITENALRYIATLADGSMRDSLSILDQCMAFFYGEEITIEKVQDIVGAVDTQVFFQMTDGLIEQNAQLVMDLVDEIINNGRDVLQFVSEFTVHLRNLLVVTTVDEAEAILDMSEDGIQRLKEQGKNISYEELIFFIKTFSELGNNLKYAGNQRIFLEVELIKLCSPSEKTNLDAVVARLSGLERQVKKGITVQTVAKVVEPSPQPKKERPKALPQDITEIINNWENIKDSVDIVNRNLLETATPAYMEDERLTLVFDNDAAMSIVKSKMDYFKQAFAEKTGKEVEVKLIEKKDFQAWERITYGDTVAEEDTEFESLLSGYFPEGDFEY